MTGNGISAVMLAIVLVGFGPAALDAQTLQQSDVAAIEEAAVDYVLKNAGLPRGEIGFDENAFVGRQRGVGRSAARSAALAWALGAKLVKKADVLRCPGNPSTCRLAVAALIRLGEVVQTPQGAYVVFELTRPTNRARTPIHRTTRELHFSKQRGKWTLIPNVGRRSET